MNIIKKLKTQLIVAIVLCCASMGFAQVVQVPSNCRVVVAGIGGTLGFGPTGRVGQGGMVAMPDILLVSPFTTNQGGSFTFIPPVVIPAITTATWSLLGDLSNTAPAGSLPGVVGNYNGVTQPPAGLSATILSYNKSYRSSEGVAPSSPSWARSNGQVRVSWTTPGCGTSITFNVYKNFNPTITTITPPITPVAAVPIIVGPSCLKPLTQYTYSVDQIVSDNANDAIGFDSYYWSGLPSALVSANTTYRSADSSSITFTTGAVVTPFTLQCCYGRVNPNTADGGVSSLTNLVVGSPSTCVTKALIVSPTAPIYVTAPPTCLPTNVPNLGSFTVVYPNVPVTVPPTTYTWTAPNTGWTLSTSLVPPANVNTALTVNTNGNLNPGTLTLTINGGCDPVIINYQINRSITAPFTVVPVLPTTTCLNSTSTGNNYTLSPNPGGNSIEWVTIPGTNPANPPAAVAGVTLVNANTATVTVNTTGATGNFLLVARSGVASCNSTFVFTQINLRPAAPTVVVGTVPPTCVPLSSAGLTTFSVTSPGASSYTWTLPAGWINSGTVAQQTSGNPTLVPPVNNSAVGAAALPPGVISVVANSASGCSSTPTNFTVNYIRITTNTLQAGAGNCDQYSINTNVAPCMGTITNWTVNGVTAVNSATVNIFGNTITLCGSTAPPAGGICANIVISGVAYNTCSSTIATGTHGLRQTTPKIVLDGVTISPNPNNGTFSIRVDDVNESATAILTDVTGKEISSHNLIKGENKIQNEQLTQGSYFVILLVDGKQETRQIIVK
jgi:hypothetical protein